MGEKKRFAYIDAAKGLGILLVIIGHSISSDTLAKRWIFSFHMPLFFFLSGCVSKPLPSGRAFLSLIAKRFDGLLIPYVLYSTIYLLMGIKPGDLASFVRCEGVSVSWFFTSLFAVEVVGALVLRLHAFSVALAATSVVLATILGFYVHYTFLVALGFWYLGYLWCQYDAESRIRNVGVVKGALVILLAAATSSMFLLSPFCCDMKTCQYGNIAVYHLTAFGGILLSLMFAVKVPGRLQTAFSEIGRRSLLLMVLHIPVISLGSVIFLPWSNRLVYRLGSVGLLILIAEVLYRYMPIASGKMKLARRFFP